jgi:hypothetical protein
MAKVWLAGGIFVAMLLAGCAGGPFGGQSASTAVMPDGMAGRWMLAAPNAPVCGMNFGGAPGAREGKVAPEGGCPEKFYLSRRWALEADILVINDDENNPMARFTLTGTRYEGQSTTGTPVTLARQTIPAN